MPSSQALTLYEASQMTTPSALRPEQTREAGPGHRVHPKNRSPCPFPGGQDTLAQPDASVLSFCTSQDLFRQHGFVFSKYGIYLYLPTANTQDKTGVNWEGELFIKHAHSNFID